MRLQSSSVRKEKSSHHRNAFGSALSATIFSSQRKRSKLLISNQITGGAHTASCYWLPPIGVSTTLFLLTLSAVGNQLTQVRDLFGIISTVFTANIPATTSTLAPANSRTEILDHALYSKSTDLSSTFSFFRPLDVALHAYESCFATLVSSYSREDLDVMSLPSCLVCFDCSLGSLCRLKNF